MQKKSRYIFTENGLVFQNGHGADGRAVGLRIPQRQGADGEQPFGQLIQITEVFDDHRLVGVSKLPYQRRWQRDTGQFSYADLPKLAIQIKLLRHGAHGVGKQTPGRFGKGLLQLSQKGGAKGLIALLSLRVVCQQLLDLLQ